MMLTPRVASIVDYWLYNGSNGRLACWGEYDTKRLQPNTHMKDLK